MAVDQKDQDKIQAPEKIQLMKTGTFSYWELDDTEISTDFFDKMILNHNEKSRGIDAAVDYGHNAYAEAAGWIKGLEKDPSGKELWASVKWTPAAQKKLEDGEYKYISAEFDADYMDESGKKCGPTLFGAGLTNRPFLKKMEPLSEFDEQEKPMTPEEKKKLDELEREARALREQLNSAEEAKKLAEKKNSDLEREKTLESEKSKKATTFNRLLAEGKVVEAQRDPFMADDMVKFSELAGKVNLKAQGNSGGGLPSESTKSFSEMTPDEAEKKIIEMSESLAKEKGISFMDASKIIMFEEKELAQKRDQKFF